MKRFILLISFLGSVNTWAAKQVSSIDGTNVLNDKFVHLETKAAAKGTVVIFMSAKCPCSASHESLLKDMSAEFKDFNFVAVHSNSDEQSAMTKEHFEKAALPFPVIQDSKSRLANDFGALKTPHAFVVNPAGEIVYQGGVTDSHVGPSAKKQFLKDALEDIQAGKTVRMKEGRALGCFIQREDS
ncbi:thioredoxin family protein [Bdellovibrio sp. ZAP7]|uniref:redoxin domain-containing protein n=1 Tax=Bdellovibrio sp. ZAP7 TaxID=2231053 RepID=UPI00115BB601|nr:redoxin domain-containing protein [Bdellovibrio sp. ZAP7]QDK45857.1 thioredoxin family protein [Bdellovibrio sp. ZAP7]